MIGMRGREEIGDVVIGQKKKEKKLEIQFLTISMEYIPPLDVWVGFPFLAFSIISLPPPIFVLFRPISP